MITPEQMEKLLKIKKNSPEGYKRFINTYKKQTQGEVPEAEEKIKKLKEAYRKTVSNMPDKKYLSAIQEDIKKITTDIGLLRKFRKIAEKRRMTEVVNKFRDAEKNLKRGAVLKKEDLTKAESQIRAWASNEEYSIEHRKKNIENVLKNLSNNIDYIKLPEQTRTYIREKELRDRIKLLSEGKGKEYEALKQREDAQTRKEFIREILSAGGLKGKELEKQTDFIYSTADTGGDKLNSIITWYKNVPGVRGVLELYVLRNMSLKDHIKFAFETGEPALGQRMFSKLSNDEQRKFALDNPEYNLEAPEGEKQREQREEDDYNRRKEIFSGILKKFRNNTSGMTDRQKEDYFNKLEKKLEQEKGGDPEYTKIKEVFNKVFSGVKENINKYKNNMSKTLGLLRRDGLYEKISDADAVKYLIEPAVKIQELANGRYPSPEEIAFQISELNFSTDALNRVLDEEYEKRRGKNKTEEYEKKVASNEAVRKMARYLYSINRDENIKDIKDIYEKYNYDPTFIRRAYDENITAKDVVNEMARDLHNNLKLKYLSEGDQIPDKLKQSAERVLNNKESATADDIMAVKTLYDKVSLSEDVIKDRINKLRDHWLIHPHLSKKQAFNELEKLNWEVDDSKK